VLRVHECAIHADVEDPTGAFDEKRLGSERFLELGSQTDRLGLVASLHAIGDRDVHSGLRNLTRLDLKARSLQSLFAEAEPRVDSRWSTVGAELTSQMAIAPAEPNICLDETNSRL